MVAACEDLLWEPELQSGLFSTRTCFSSLHPAHVQNKHNCLEICAWSEPRTSRFEVIHPKCYL